MEEVISLLKKKKLKFDYEIKTYLTPGDRDKTTSLEQVEGTDFFTRDIENALIKGDIDVAIHSAKDLPEKIKNELYIAAITKGVDNRDVLVVRKDLTDFINRKSPIMGLPKNFILGTSSKRRKEQIKKLRNDVKIIDIRGNIEERLNLVEKKVVDGIIIAAAGLIRLNLQHKIFAYLNFVTSPLQGRLAIEIKDENENLKEIFTLIDDRHNWGEVYIIGAGPGNKDLLTLKALNVLKDSDCILYDCLVNEDILKDFNCKKILVGKRKNKKYMEQEEINIKMARLAQIGYKVSRLKGGDPTVFAQISEEIKFLKRNYINYEIIPGVSSFTGAACYAELPLTEKNKRSYFLVSTGFPIKNAYIPEKKFKGTMVYLMCGDTIKQISKKLINKGWSLNTELILIFNATNYNQKIIRSTIGGILKNNKVMKKPVIAYIGKKISLDNIGWFEKKSKILFTGTNPEKYYNLGEIIHQKLIELKKVDFYLDLKKLKKFNCIIFTSKYAVKFFFEKLFKLKIDSRALKNKLICSIGEITTEELKKYGIIPDIESKKHTAKDLFLTFKSRRIKNKKIYYPCSNLSENELCDGITKLGNEVEKEIIYLNEMPRKIKPINLKFIDKYFFTAPSTVRNFKKVYKFVPDDNKILAIGPVTLEAIKNEKVS